MDGWTRVAHLGRTRNLNGGLVCTAADGLPFLLQEGLRVAFVPPTLRGVRQAMVRDVQPLRNEEWEVFFSGVDTLDDAAALVGAYCLAQESDLPSVEDANAVPHIIGFTVVDSAFGTLGQVVDVLENPAQSTLVVEGGAGDILVPWVDAFVEEVDSEKRVITTTIPESLLTLNAPTVHNTGKSHAGKPNTVESNTIDPATTMSGTAESHTEGSSA